MSNVIDYKVGDAVEIYDTFAGKDTVVCTGNVERLTKQFVFVRNQHGNEGKFRLKDSKTVGYHWPQVTSMLRKVGTTGNTSIDKWNARVAQDRAKLVDAVLEVCTHLDRIKLVKEDCGFGV